MIRPAENKTDRPTKDEADCQHDDNEGARHEEALNIFGRDADPLDPENAHRSHDLLKRDAVHHAKSGVRLA